MSCLISTLYRPTLIIDCEPIYNASSDALVIRNLANQTGYAPVFGGLAWVNRMIDMASVGLIGQKGVLVLSLFSKVTALTRCLFLSSCTSWI